MCAKDVEQFNSIYYKVSFVDENVFIHLFRLHTNSFYSAETWCIKLNNKYLKRFQYLIIKLSNVSVEETLTKDYSFSSKTVEPS